MQAPPEVRREEGLLRLEVAALRRREQRERFDPHVYVGRLAPPEGSPRGCFVVWAQDHPVLDTAMAFEVVTGLVEAPPDGSAQRPAYCLLARPGTPDLHDSDLVWLRAARRAFAVQGRPLAGFFVVTRFGWHEPLTGRTRTWLRLRLRAEAAAVP